MARDSCVGMIAGQGVRMIAVRIEVRREAQDSCVVMIVVRIGRVERTQGAPMIEVRIEVRRVARDLGVAMTVGRSSRVE